MGARTTRKQIYAKQTTIGCFTLHRNPALCGTIISINLSWDGSWWSIWERQEDVLDIVIICISHRGDFLLLFSYPDNFFNSLPYHTDSSSISTDQDTWQQVTIPISLLSNKAVYGLPFHPHVELTSVHRNDSGPSQLPSPSIRTWSFMYVTLVQNISASTWSVSSLCDSLKHLNLHQIDPFLSQNLAITCYSTLYKKRTLFIHIHLYEINTGPTTYLIGTHQRWTSNAVLSHTFCANKLKHRA